MDGSWWRQDCPKRGVGLQHAHWTACRPDGVHPHDDTGNEGNNHPATMCCHCQFTEAMEREAHIAMKAATAGLPATSEHTDGTPVERKAIDPNRTRQAIDSVVDLTVDEVFRLAINVVELERRRGYR